MRRACSRIVRHLSAAAIVLCVATGAHATPTLLALADFNAGPGALIEIDPATGAGTLIGEISGGPGNGLWTGLARRGSQLYAVSGFDNSLYAISSTGAATLIGPSGIDDREGYLEFSPSGTLYSGSGDQLYTVDLGSGASTLVGETGLDDPNGLAFDASGNAFLLEGNSNSTGRFALFGLDESTGNTVPIGDLGLDNVNGVGGLAFFGSELRGAVNDSLYQVDPETGAAILIGAIGFTGVSSLVSVPEPASGALVGLGLLGLAARRHRTGRAR
jgi:hypothetical protein